MPKRSQGSVITIPTINKSGDDLFNDNVTKLTSHEEDSSDSEESEYEGLESEDEEEGSSSDDFFKLDDENQSGVSDNEEEDENEDDEDEVDEKEQLKEEIRKDEIIEKPVVEQDRSGNESDDSNEEELRNTIGNVPIEWYNDYPHIGYNLEGKKILKPATGDELDDFLAKMDDPNYWRTIKDKQTMKEIILTDQELEMIDRIQNKQYPANADDPYKPYIDHFTSIKMIHPLSNAPEPKSRFIPSKWEHKKIIKIVRAIRNGWIKPKKTEAEKPRYYMLWDQDDLQEKSKRHKMHIPAPKMKLPGHDESYNPPPEYLPNDEEIAKWEKMDPEERPRNFLPKKYSSLRLVPGYGNFIQERFERCLDLYLCPRQRKMRLNVNPDDLIPKLPKPKDLQPFPTTQAIIYEGHKGVVRCISVDPSGQWMVSGGDDETIRFWEISSSRCLKTLHVENSVQSVSWNPNPSLSLVIAVAGNLAMVINTGLGDKLISAATDQLISSYKNAEEAKEELVNWTEVTVEQSDFENGTRLYLRHKKTIQQTTWHGKGDYFSVVIPEGANQSVIIHQLSKRRSQQPFRKSKGLIQCVRFHPTKPFLFVATQRYVRVYDLSKQELLKKLQSTAKWISSMAIHPNGDNLIIGSYDRRLCWFDMDLSTYPYTTMRHHKEALRQVCYHTRYPLFASCSDDGSVIICHGTVFSDLMQNPLIVPVKILRGHGKVNNLSVTDCVFHPSQPWILTSGADSTIRLYV